MKQMLKLLAVSVALTVNFGATYAQNKPTPKPEDAERNAFETPTAGKNAPGSSKSNKDGISANPESRMNDNPPPQERVGAPNTSPK